MGHPAAITGRASLRKPVDRAIASILEHLLAGRFDAARYDALFSGDRPHLPTHIMDLLRARRWPDAICAIEREFYPKWESSREAAAAYCEARS